MRIVRYVQNGQAKWGRVEGENVRPMAGPPWEGFDLKATGLPAPLGSVRLLAPITPTKIIAVGRNYVAHAAEFGNLPPEEPILFSKVVGSVIGPGEPILLPPGIERIDHEGELGVVIGRRARNVSPEEAADYVFGLTCLNDVSARDFQMRDKSWTRGKGLDTFCPAGPWVKTGLDSGDLSLRVMVNGEVRQDTRTSLMVFPVPVLVSYISRMMTLFPGDVIATGTPAGVGPLRPGDRVAVEIEGLGRLENPVHAA